MRHDTLGEHFNMSVCVVKFSALRAKGLRRFIEDSQKSQPTSLFLRDPKKPRSFFIPVSIAEALRIPFPKTTENTIVNLSQFPDQTGSLFSHISQGDGKKYGIAMDGKPLFVVVTEERVREKLGKYYIAPDAPDPAA
jgi:hypothetical protein